MATINFTLPALTLLMLSLSTTAFADGYDDEHDTQESMIEESLYPLLEAFDTNKDEVLQHAEAQAASQYLINLADSNGDAALSAIELRHLVIQQQFNEFDLNRDGMISLYELNAEVEAGEDELTTQQAFNVLDNNQDGMLSLHEFHSTIQNDIEEAAEMNEQLNMIIAKFDIDQNGLLSLSEVQQILR